MKRSKYCGDRKILAQGRLEIIDGLPVRRLPPGSIKKMDEYERSSIGFAEKTTAFEVARFYGHYSPKHPQPKTMPESEGPGDPDQVLGDNGKRRMGSGYTLVGGRLPEGQDAQRSK